MIVVIILRRSIHSLSKWTVLHVIISGPRGTGSGPLAICCLFVSSCPSTFVIKPRFVLTSAPNNFTGNSPFTYRWKSSIMKISSHTWTITAMWSSGSVKEDWILNESPEWSLVPNCQQFLPKFPCDSQTHAWKRGRQKMTDTFLGHGEQNSFPVY